MTDDRALPPLRPAADTAVPATVASTLPPGGERAATAANDQPPEPAANDRPPQPTAADRRPDAAAPPRPDDAFIIEVGDEAPGLVVRERGGFRFVAADGRYASLDGRLFRDPTAAERAARDLHRRRAG